MCSVLYVLADAKLAGAVLLPGRHGIGNGMISKVV